MKKYFLYLLAIIVGLIVGKLLFGNVFVMGIAYVLGAMYQNLIGNVLVLSAVILISAFVRNYIAVVVSVIVGSVYSYIRYDLGNEYLFGQGLINSQPTDIQNTLQAIAIFTLLFILSNVVYFFSMKIRENKNIFKKNQ